MERICRRRLNARGRAKSVWLANVYARLNRSSLSRGAALSFDTFGYTQGNQKRLKMFMASHVVQSQGALLPDLLSAVHVPIHLRAGGDADEWVTRIAASA